MRIRLANTKQFLALEKDSRGRNQGPSKKLLKIIDPSGIHVVEFLMIHNDCECRCRWVVKVKDQKLPITVTMDNSFEALDQNSSLVDNEDIKEAIEREALEEIPALDPCRLN
ncbi:MAG TPA: hypothetical protein EYN67_00735 [Flavobacteriales bacterium]|nr:hypothetical protein [Flavobacteriales bacterium]